VVGGVLTADPGAWTGDDPITYSYEWSDGGTDSTDTLSTADVGQYLTVTVTATNDAGSASVTTDGYGPVLPLALAIDPDGADDHWDGSAGRYVEREPGFVEQRSDRVWLPGGGLRYLGDNCAAITGATSSSYALSAADIGSTIVCVVTATGPGGSTPASTKKTPS
jgi:hypothetical protein